MRISRRSFRQGIRVTLFTIVAVVVLSFAAAGVGAKRANFFDSFQAYFDLPVDIPGISAQTPISTTDARVNAPACNEPLIKEDGPVMRSGPNAPATTCPLTVLANDGGTSGNARAPSTRFASSRAVYLIKASELAAAGYTNGQTPTTIGWNYQAAPVTGGSAPLTIYLQNTADTTYTKGTSFSAAISGMTTVHSATTALPGTVGTFDITLTGGSPFTYTGGGLYVAFDWGPYAGTLSTTAVIYCNSTGLANGLAGVNSNSDTLAASSFRPETRLSSSTQNDAAVTSIYSYGELPRGLVPAQGIKAVITNKGALAQTNIPVTLTVTGVDTFTDTQVIPSLTSCGGQATVTFASFTPIAVGSDTLTVTIPADDVSTNNSLSKALSITPLSYTYKIPASTTTGGVGLTGGSGIFMAKFTTLAANAVTDVKLEFAAASATTYRVAIYGDSGTGTPSTTALYLDAADRTVAAAGPVTINLPSPVAVGPGNFFVGIQQTNTTNASLSFDPEAPIRSGAFYLATAIPPVTWSDFSPNNSFKLNIGLNLQTAAAPAVKARADFDGDGKTDIAVYRPSEGNWYLNRSAYGFGVVHWGLPTDTIIPGDYDGDGKADFAVWRPTATDNVADFYILNSNGFTISGYAFGLPGDIPMAGDYDGDGKIDIAVYRPSTTTWWIWKSQTQAVVSFQFGSSGDIPMVMDFNGDGKADLAVYRPSNNFWYMNNASGTPAQNFTAVQWGLASDILVPADYDGDGKDDVAVFRPSDGFWYIRRSSDNGTTFTQFGVSGDVAVPGDYDGDGKADVAVFRPSTGTWYLNRSTSGFSAQAFGLSTDTAVPAAYHP